MLRFLRLSAAAAAALAVVVLGSPPALACNPGAVACQGGYLYVCRCWTSTGCRFEYSGTCLRDDPAEPPAATLDPAAALLEGTAQRAARTRPISLPAPAAAVH